MCSKRRRFAGELKAKVALEALRGDRTLQEIASKCQVHPNQVGAWKRQAIEGLGEVFSKGTDGFTARRLIGEWVRFYNAERPHSALDGEPRPQPTEATCLWT